MDSNAKSNYTETIVSRKLFRFSRILADLDRTRMYCVVMHFAARYQLHLSLTAMSDVSGLGKSNASVPVEETVWVNRIGLVVAFVSHHSI